MAKNYNDGYRDCAAAVVNNLIVHLPSREMDVVQLLLEREATVRALRAVCQKHGDNDWPDDRYLADVVEKHLHRHLGGVKDC